MEMRMPVRQKNGKKFRPTLQTWLGLGIQEREEDSMEVSAALWSMPGGRGET